MRWRQVLRRILMIGGLGLAAIVAAWFALLAVGSEAQRPARPVAIASGEWRPFVSPELEDGGPMAVIVAETLRQAGYEPDLDFVSWPIALERTRRGELFGSFPLIASEDRVTDYEVSDPIMSFDYVLFYNKEAWPEPPPLATVEDFGGIRVGRIAGYKFWPELEAAVDDQRTYSSNLAAFRALADGEIDLLPEGLTSGLAVVEGAGILIDSRTIGIVPANGNPLLSSTETLHFLMPRSQRSGPLMDQFNTALEGVRETELYELSISAAGASSVQTTVALVPIDPAGLVELIDDETVLYAPTGSKAVVLEWPDPFVRGQASPGDPAVMVEVKILNGPAQGKVVAVDARSIRVLQVEEDR